MAGGIDVEVIGLLEVQRKMTQAVRDLRGTPVLSAFRRATLYVLRDAKRFAPVDTNRLRASITPDIRVFAGGDPIVGVATGEGLYGVVGSNVEYAPFQEFGTRYMAGKFFLKRALEANTENIMNEIGDAVAEIIRK